MAPWAGWGAGPAGAGSAGGPSRVFVLLALLGAVVVTAVLAKDRRFLEASVTALAAVYFGLRVAGVLGGRRGGGS
ncbi:MAG TPA: hypothetical protein VMK42_02560 [Anaeromyxobacteraceae bacterium]|nr:hypothetical protein [Anaeromyxobacteraceae bacterium]